MARILPTSMRLDPDVKAALAAAAVAEDRSVSNLVERILRAWLVEHGHMKAPMP